MKSSANTSLLNVSYRGVLRELTFPVPVRRTDPTFGSLAMPDAEVQPVCISTMLLKMVAPSGPWVVR